MISRPASSPAVPRGPLTWVTASLRRVIAVLHVGPDLHGRDGRFEPMRDVDEDSFDSLQHLLRIADTWPSGRTGTKIRRAACDLIESRSRWSRAVSHFRLRACVAGVYRRRASGRSRDDDPSELLVMQLMDALQRDMRRQQP